uniref:low affinity immunoglobulin gamma Fc region receptor II-a-like n=1 Tax=Semicossyphus pulcher TaxID=241346 RepID=UPI0037E75A03
MILQLYFLLTSRLSPEDIMELMTVSMLLAAQVHLKYAQESGFPLIVPTSLQLFEYKALSFNCEGFDVQTGLTVMKKIQGNVSKCVTNWEATSQFVCSIKPAYTADSGVYWCESAEGERSKSVNITVTAEAVILESPVRPVTEGDTVSLRCRSKMTSSAQIADFYKDGLFIGSGSAGEISIQSVSKSNEGLYKCSISDFGESPQSWLAVRAAPGETRPPSDHSCHTYLVLRTVFTVVMVALLLLLVGLLHCGKLRVTQKYVCICKVCKGSCQKNKGDNDKEQLNALLTSEAGEQADAGRWWIGGAAEEH